MIRNGRQSGAVLAVSLIILLVLTLIGIASVNTGVMELRIANNEEEQMKAFQSSQAALDAVFNKAFDNFTVTDVPGEIKRCSGTACNTELWVDSPVFTAESNLLIHRLEPLTPCPPRIFESSCGKYFAASFSVESTYNKTDAGGGKTVITQGFMTLVSK